MSFDAVTWALRQHVRPASAKFLLVAFAAHANRRRGDYRVFPSTAALAQMTGLDPKTVEGGKRVLLTQGFIADTGQRRGRTGSVKVYEVLVHRQASPTDIGGPSALGSDTDSGGTSEDESDTDSGGASGDERTTVFPGSPTVFGSESHRFRSQVPPKTVHGTRKGTEKGTREREQGASAKLPPCPHLALLRMFEEELPDWPAPRAELWEGSQAARNLNDRWTWLLTAHRSSGARYASTEQEALTWFRNLLRFAGESEFLRKAKWRSLRKLVEVEHFTALVEGLYAD